MNGRATTMIWAVAVLTSLAGMASARLALRDRLADARTSRSASQDATKVPVVHEHWVPSSDSVWMKAPFRSSRAPAPDRYTPSLVEAREVALAEVAAREAQAEAAAEAAAQLAAQRPPWVLTGVILAEPPLALFSQIPTQVGGTVLTTGDEVDGFVVSQIGADSVVVTRDGQVWTFGVTRPWS